MHHQNQKTEFTMKRLFFALSLFAGILSIALLTLSCSDNDDDKNKPLLTLTDTFSSATKDGVVMTLSTLNSEGEPTLYFSEGEEIIFDLKIENTTEEYLGKPGGPWTLGYNTFRVFTLAEKDCDTSWSYPQDWTAVKEYLGPYSSEHYQCPWYSEEVIKATSPFIFKPSNKRLTRGTYFTEAYYNLDNGTVLHCVHYFNIE